MIVKKLDWTAYELKFKSPFLTSQKTFTSRKIIIVRLEDEEKFAGYGEAAPLHEFGSETFEEAELILARFNKEFSGAEITYNHISVKKFLSRFKKYPTVHSAVEQALLSILSLRSSEISAELLPAPKNKSVLINGLVGIHSTEQCVETALILSENGYAAIKIKAGRENFEEDLTVITKIRKAVGYQIKLRIDVNGKWSYDNAEKYINELQSLNLEYIEQPVLSTEELIRLAEISPIPIAADESLRNLNTAELLLENSKVNFFVVKPMLIGGLLNSIELINLAEKNRKNIIFSSSFESNLGKNILLMLCSIYPSKFAQGPAAFNYFENDILPGNYTINNGKLFFTNTNFLRQNNLEFLFSK